MLVQFLVEFLVDKSLWGLPRALRRLGLGAKFCYRLAYSIAFGLFLLAAIALGG